MTDSALTLQADTQVEIGPLVVPVGSTSAQTHPSEDAALRLAGWLARTRESRVVLVRVAAVPEDWHLWEPHASKAAVESRGRQERRGDRLVEAARALYYDGLPVEVEVVRRVDVPAGIAEAAADVEANLVVMGAPCLREAARQPSLCKAAQVVARRGCGVLAVFRNEAPAARRGAALRRVVLVMPAGEPERFGSALAVALAAHHGATLDVVMHADDPEACDPRKALEALRSGGSNGRRVDHLEARPVQAAMTVVEGLPGALRTAAGLAPDLAIVTGGYEFDAVVEAGGAEYAAAGGDWAFAFPPTARA